MQGQTSENIIKKDLSKFPLSPNLLNYPEFYKNFSWKDKEKEITFFDDGTLNAAYNAVDRHALGAKKIRLRFYLRELPVKKNHIHMVIYPKNLINLQTFWIR